MKKHTFTPDSYRATDRSKHGHRNPHSRARVGASLACVAALAACATGPKLEQRPPTAEVAPIERPDYPVGTVFRQVSNVDGSVKDWEVLEVSADGTMTGRNADGCTWTRPADPMSPATEWSGCGTGEWSSGTATITSVSGDLWPLAPGNEATWKHTPKSSRGNGSAETTRCRVGGPFAITTRLGELDALKVTCKNTWSVRTSWWSAEHGEVRAWRVNNKDGLRWDNELTGEERPAS